MKRLALLAALLALPGVALTAPRTLIRDQSEVTFAVKQMGVTVAGRFREFSARIDLDPAAPAGCSAEIVVATGSVDTGTPEADEVASDKPWLDVTGFPQARFTSSAVRALGANRYEAKGQLSIKGRPRAITVPFTLDTAADGSALARGEFMLLRTDFGVGGGEWNDTDLVANEVRVVFRFRLAPAK